MKESLRIYAYIYSTPSGYGTLQFSKLEFAPHTAYFSRKRDLKRNHTAANLLRNQVRKMLQ